MDYNGRRLRHEQKYYISYGEYYNLVSKLSAVLKRDGNYGDKGYFIRSKRMRAILQEANIAYGYTTIPTNTGI